MSWQIPHRFQEVRYLPKSLRKVLNESSDVVCLTSRLQNHPVGDQRLATQSDAICRIIHGRRPLCNIDAKFQAAVLCRQP